MSMGPEEGPGRARREDGGKEGVGKEDGGGIEEEVEININITPLPSNAQVGCKGFSLWILRAEPCNRGYMYRVMPT